MRLPRPTEGSPDETQAHDWWVPPHSPQRVAAPRSQLPPRSPNDERKAVVDDAAKQLGVTPAKLCSALKKALENRVDAAVAAGRLTKDQGEALKKRIESDDYPALGLGFGLGHHGGPGGMHRGGHLDAAAAYLGRDPGRAARPTRGREDARRRGQGRRASRSTGSSSALVADEKKKLDAAVKAGRITQAQADAILADAKQRVHRPRERDVQRETAWAVRRAGRRKRAPADSPAPSPHHDLISLAAPRPERPGRGVEARPRLPQMA